MFRFKFYELTIYMNTPLSNDQIDRALQIENSYIVKYWDLDNFSTLSDLFGSKPFIILLIESDYNAVIG